MAARRREAARAGSSAAVHLVPPFLLSAYPLALVLGANLGIVPMDWSVVGRLLVVSLAATAVMLVALQSVLPRVDRRAAWLSTFYIACAGYDILRTTVNALGWGIDPSHPAVAAAYVAAAAGLATWVARLGRDRPRDPWPWVIAAIALLGASLAGAPGRLAAAGGPEWRAVAETLTDPGEALPLAPGPERRPDIYYVVLDGFGRPDVLGRLFDLDVAPFVDALRSRGFRVADEATSNYAQTYLSLASLLNVTHLDDVARVLGPDSQNRLPLDDLVQRAVLFTAARRSGYRVVAIGSDYLATSRFEGVDVCLCDRYGLHDISQAVLLKTPLAGLGVGRWNYGSHRRQVLDAFEHLGAIDSVTAPTFAFAHILAPHPPFVFQADGSPRDVRGVFGFDDAEYFPGSRDEYVDGYRAQVRFVSASIVTLVDRVIARAGRESVIVIHADHGPASRLSWEQPDDVGIEERMAILLAYRDPAGGLGAKPLDTPIGVAWAMARAYFGLSRAEPDAVSRFSTWARPYDFLPVTSGSGSPDRNRR